MHIADTVHYVETVDDVPVCRAAIITKHGAEVENSEANQSLAVIVYSQPYIVDEIAYNSTPTGGTWHKGGGTDCSN